MYPKQYCDLFWPRPNPDDVFVGMSFAPPDQDRWHAIIRPAIEGVGLRPHRVDLGCASDSILIEILNGVMNSRILLFDITADAAGARNGNVMYELGLAHALRGPEEVLIVRSDRSNLLFDVSNIRVHYFDAASAETAKEQVAGLIRAGIGSIRTAQALAIEKAIATLDEVCLGFIHSHASMEYFSCKARRGAFSQRTVAIRAAIRVLMDLGMVRLNWLPDQRVYAFSWTPFGRAVVERLGMASRAGEPIHPKSDLGYSDRKPTVNRSPATRTARRRARPN